jgi:hypothetical protein
MRPVSVGSAVGPDDHKRADDAGVKQAESEQEGLRARLSPAGVVCLEDPGYAGFLMAETSISRLIFSETITPPASRAALKLTP